MVSQTALSFVRDNADKSSVGPPERCVHCKVRETSLCSSMSNRDLAALSGLGRTRRILAGQVINWPGDASTSCANIVSGALKLTATLADGREQIVGLLFQGDFVGQLFAEEMSITVVALTDTDLCSYPRAGFELVLDTFPKLERLLLKRTISSLNDARVRMLTLGRKNALERVAGFVFELAQRIGQADGKGNLDVLLPISRGEIADFLGLTIETVSRQMTRLKAAAIIDFARGERGCKVLDVNQLEMIVNPI